jgi:hypothetical protein
MNYYIRSVAKLITAFLLSLIVIVIVFIIAGIANNDITLDKFNGLKVFKMLMFFLIPSIGCSLIADLHSGHEEEK